jgi:hypothetical protein
MTNQHLVPGIVTDLVQRLNSTSLKTEKMNIQLRLEAIRDYCTEAINKNNNKISFDVPRKNKKIGKA